MTKFYPTKASALNVVHPSAGPLKFEGSDWPEDGFTGRMIMQEIISSDSAKRMKESDLPDSYKAAQEAKKPRDLKKPGDEKSVEPAPEKKVAAPAPMHDPAPPPVAPTDKPALRS